MTTFAQLNLQPSILEAIASCGYTTPTDVQAQSIPIILEGKDLAACAPTGTGKTAAFILPALNQLAEKEPIKKTRILILTPTRELATQITKAAHLYGKFLRFNIVSLVGGMSYHHQIRDLSRGADIIVATPGRLLDHIEQKRVDLSHVEMLVLDEADRMLDMGFIDDVEYIAKLTPKNRQTLLFSATLDKQLANVVRHLLKHPVRVDLSNQKLAVPKIKQELYRANNPQHKSRLLKHVLSNTNIFKAIIFSSTKINADKLAYKLCDLGYAAAPLHGDLKQSMRNRTIEQLRRGEIQFLVATDVAARGIDIQDLTHVINYDLPKFCEDYVHRIGRTGRAGKTGTAISFALPTDNKHLQRIERYLGEKLHVVSNVQLGPETYDDETEAQPKKKLFSEENYKKDKPWAKKKHHGEEHRSSRAHKEEKPWLKKKRHAADETHSGSERSEKKSWGKKHRDDSADNSDSRREKPWLKRKHSDSTERSGSGRDKPWLKKKRHATDETHPGSERSEKKSWGKKHRDDSADNSDSRRAKPWLKRKHSDSIERSESGRDKPWFKKKRGGDFKEGSSSEGERKPWFKKKRDGAHASDAESERKSWPKKKRGDFNQSREKQAGSHDAKQDKPWFKKKPAFRKKYRST